MTDNSWYEKGELPPVDTECELYHNEKWRKAIVAATVKSSHGNVAIMQLENDWDYCSIKSRLRPIKSDREKAIDEIENILFNNFTTDQMELDVVKLSASILYDAGYRKTEGDV